MLNVEVDVNGDIAALLQKAKDAGVNLTIPFTTIAKSWFKANRSIFALKGPGKYQDLSPKYKKAKIRRWGFAYPIMRASGYLEASLTDPTHPDAINFIVNKNTLYLGTRVEYAPYHQSSAPRKKLPYRPIVFIGAEQIAPTEIRNESTRWVNILEDSIQQKLDQASGGR